MDAEFSEFSYGFALTYELVSHWRGRFHAAPVFPSLIDEGRHRGYDVALQPGFPLFLQFKLSEYMTRRSAGQWRLFNSPYYRFWIYPPRLSEQHDLLLNLDYPPNLVYYAAPCIHETNNLNAAFLQGQVADGTVFIRPRRIGKLPDDDYHCIAFQPNNSYGYWCSEPERLKIASKGEGITHEIVTFMREHDPAIPSNDYFGNLVNRLQVAGMRASKLASVPQYQEILSQSLRRQAAYLTRTVLGAELIWLSRE